MADGDKTQTIIGAAIAIGAGIGAAMFAAADNPVWIGVGAGIGAAIGAGHRSATQAGGRMSARIMQQAAVDLLEGLSDEQRAAVNVPFDDPRREIWMYWPREMTGDSYPGVGIHRMSFEQRQLTMRLVAAGVDHATLGQIAAIMALDYPLNAAEQYTRNALRDPVRYWITIYGEPADAGTWSWHFEGHHVVVSHVIIDGEVVSSTPMFLGANPARIKKGEHFVSRPCGPEEDAGRALLASLDADRRQRAVLDAPAPIDVIVHRFESHPRRGHSG